MSSLPSNKIPTPALFIALLLLDGMHFVWARIMAGLLPPLLSTTLYFAVAGLQVGAFAWWKGKLSVSELRRKWWFFAAIGLCIAISTNINYYAARLIDPATGTLMTQSLVVYNLLFGLVWFKDKLTRGQIAGALLCVAGVVVISFQPGDYLRFGSLMVLGGSLMYSLHAALVKRFSGDIDFVTFFAWRLIITFCFGVVATTIGGAWQWPSAQAWLVVLLGATLDVSLSRALYYTSLRRLTISLHTLLMTMSPVMAATWAYVIFGLTPSIQQLIGGLLVMAGVATVSLMRAR